MKTVMHSSLVHFAVLFSLLSTACALTKGAKYEFVQEWNLWKTQHDKNYLSSKEDLEKHLVWLSNKEYIDQHNANAGVFGYTLAMNHMGDESEMEYQDRLSGYRMPPNETKNQRVFVADPLQSYPTSIDWRTSGVVTSVKSQGDCGASYAFSAIGSLEGMVSLAKNELVTLSEQNIIDCSVSYGNHGCNGGDIYNTYQYIIANEGVDTSDGYPYKERQSTCYFDSKYVGAEISGSIKISSGDEYSLKGAVASAGPISVGVDASSNSFRFYDSGLYNQPGCSSSYLSHALLVTGYGTYNNKDYWVLKNSWGTNWGMSGYIMMSRNKYNQCGIATDASYPTL